MTNEIQNRKTIGYNDSDLWGRQNSMIMTCWNFESIHQFTSSTWPNDRGLYKLAKLQNLFHLGEIKKQVWTVMSSNLCHTDDSIKHKNMYVYEELRLMRRKWFETYHMMFFQRLKEGLGENGPNFILQRETAFFTPTFIVQKKLRFLKLKNHFEPYRMSNPFCPGNEIRLP